MRGVTLTFLGLFSILSVGNGIRCYFCNSRRNHHCESPEFSRHRHHFETVNCEYESEDRAVAEIVANLKTKMGEAPLVDETGVENREAMIESHNAQTCQKVDLIFKGERVTVRGCSGPYPEPCATVENLVHKDITLRFCGVCENDGCNQGSLLGPSMVLPLAVGLRLARGLL